MNIAVLGAGKWGRNHVRAFNRLAGADGLHTVCDASEAVLASLRSEYSRTRMETDFEKVLDDDSIKAVVVATPVVTHADLTRRALEQGKHVLVEKPMVTDVQEAEDLVRLAEERGRVLMVGHLLLYHPAIAYIKGMISKGELGQIYYAYTHRLNLGTVRHDENALWSFAPHDLSVLLHLLEETPDRVNATGAGFLQDHIEDVCFLNLHFPSGRVAHVHVSWLDPHRARLLTLVGSQRMVVFDDTHATEKVRVYDKGIDVHQDYRTYSEYLALRTGDVHLPSLPPLEPLLEEGKHFLDCIRTGKTPLTDGRSTVDIIRILKAAQDSLEAGGVPVDLDGGGGGRVASR